MNRFHGFASKVAAAALVVAISSVSPVFARGGGHGHHGGGHHRGFHHGWGRSGGHFRGGYGGYGYYGNRYYYNSGYPTYTYSRGYSYAPSTYSAPARAPYLTNQTYAPGDGWRYPLYYNPATGRYFYYPVSR